MLIDTHAHIHFDDYAARLDEVLANAEAAGVERIVTVGVTATDSVKAAALAEKHDHVYATVGHHPHDAKALDAAAEQQLRKLAKHPKVVAVGECGLDYFRDLSPRGDQEAAFRFQIELALENDLPMVWHVRDAFDQFFEIVDQYDGLRGIVHCFTSSRANMEKAVARGFLVALNGIMTFTKDRSQLEAAKHLPLDHMALETDCPFLTPVPKRGQVNEPANVKLVAEFLADLRGESFEALSKTTSLNAQRLLKLA